MVYFAHKLILLSRAIPNSPSAAQTKEQAGSYLPSPAWSSAAASAWCPVAVAWRREAVGPALPPQCPSSPLGQGWLPVRWMCCLEKWMLWLHCTLDTQQVPGRTMPSPSRCTRIWEEVARMVQDPSLGRVHPSLRDATSEQPLLLPWPAFPVHPDLIPREALCSQQAVINQRSGLFNSRCTLASSGARPNPCDMNSS